MACMRKRGYTKTEIPRIKKGIYKQRGRKLRMYECIHCGLWHLTSDTGRRIPLPKYKRTKIKKYEYIIANERESNNRGCMGY